MAQEVPNDLNDLIVRFVQTYGNIIDLELDENPEPKLWFMPLKTYEAKRKFQLLLY